MKFYIYSTKEYADRELSRLGKLIGKLYTGAEVEVGRGRIAKYKQEKLQSEGGFVIKAEDVLVPSTKQSAINIVNLVGIGVSEGVLGKL